MHLISHFCSGFCIGSIFSSFIRKTPITSLFTFPVLIALGSIFPDLDGISVFFNHKVYYETFWYSHHGAFHSLLGIAPFSLLFSAIITFVRNRSTYASFYRSLFPIFGLIFFGNIIHILEDLPCPLGPWHGLMIFWPLSSNRFGGWAHIWWLNEYLMVLLFSGMLSSLLLLGYMKAWPSTRPKLLKTTLIIINLIVLFFSIRFVIVSRYMNPTQWQEYQRALLGDSFYTFVKFWNVVIQHIWMQEIL